MLVSYKEAAGNYSCPTRKKSQQVVQATNASGRRELRKQGTLMVGFSRLSSTYILRHGIYYLLAYVQMAYY